MQVTRARFASASRSRAGSASPRPEIQGLRALAVAGTVAYHTWPGRVPAGDAGVDVFFVVSGFLITGMLLRERRSTGGISLRRFYRRRMRRLLPAAYTVLVLCALATLALVPSVQWGYFLREIGLSGVGLENWSELLRSQSPDPAVASLPSTPALHFWSLAVEEQFYLLWPLLVLFVGRSARRAALPVVLGAIAVASFAVCVVSTEIDVNLGYFSTVSRAWELAAGGLLALVPASVRLPDAVRAVLGWAGLVAILAAMLLIRDQQHFPGWYALAPVLGAAAVIAGGMPEARWSLARLARWRPVQAVGDASYSIYLWHWPIIFLFPYATGVPTPWWGVAGLVVVSLAVGLASKRWLEDRFRLPREPLRDRDTPGLQHAAPSGKLVWFNIPAK